MIERYHLMSRGMAKHFATPYWLQEFGLTNRGQHRGVHRYACPLGECELQGEGTGRRWYRDGLIRTLMRCDPTFDVLSEYRACEQISLNLVATEQFELSPFRLGFDAFGEHESPSECPRSMIDLVTARPLSSMVMSVIKIRSIFSASMGSVRR